ncbi:Peptide deformylase [Anaerovibrio sp. JC8]|uniref:peptide deformylase n=1 Tax=Anaerovibrio sp. JC8 TaxID=1240085 RepID=UPI000A0D2853|nr:peptide deformylase [Anaerovibrio sp. JC8]ORT99645.1 Peptide deformylase [Anaerovibrio sp. JC8]
MVKDINKDIEILKKKAKPATKDDIAGVAQDLADTLQAYRMTCIGMAANMIGVPKAVIAISLDAEDGAGSLPGAGPADVLVMLNPKYEKLSGKTYTVEEGCLSLEDKHEVKRSEWVEVSYRDMRWQKKRQKFTGLLAEIVQHEMDHLEGKIV